MRGGEITGAVIAICAWTGVGLLLMLGAYAFILLLAAQLASGAAARFERAHGAMIEGEE